MRSFNSLKSLQSLRGPHSSRGQVLILGACMVLLLAFVLFSTLGMAWKVQERIRLQHATDAAAYSDALRVARGFNYFAYTNRALASNLVSLATLHAYHSEISAAHGLYQNLALGYQSIAASEIALTTCVGGIGPCQFGCFAHAAEDEMTAAKLLKKSKDFEDDLKDLDKDFESAVDGYAKSIRLIQLSQRAVQMELMGQSASGFLSALGTLADSSDGKGGNGTSSDGTDSNNDGNPFSADKWLKPFNLPAGGDLSAFVAAYNVKKIKDSMEFADDKEARTDMAEVANAARPLWVRNRLLAGNTATLAPLIARLKDDTDGVWVSTQIPIVQGAAGIYSQKPKALPTATKPEAGKEGKGIGAVDYWETSGTCSHGHGAVTVMQPFPLGPASPGLVYSSAQGASHNAHDSDVKHDLDMDEILSFMRFKITAEDKEDFGQPAITRMMEQDLSLDEQGRRMPWDIFDGGKFTGNLFGKGRAVSVQFRTDEKAKAVGSAMAYYHHAGNWKEPPNFWNPFWRAKLVKSHSLGA